MPSRRRAADGIYPIEYVDLCQEESDEEEPVPLAASSVNVPGLMCQICWEDPPIPVANVCGHIFCRECITRWKDNKHSSCPKCRLPLGSFIRLYF